MPEPQFTKGDNPKERLAQSLDALDEANGRIVNGREWYDGVRQSYRKQP